MFNLLYQHSKINTFITKSEYTQKLNTHEGQIPLLKLKNTFTKNMLFSF